VKDRFVSTFSGLNERFGSVRVALAMNKESQILLIVG